MINNKTVLFFFPIVLLSQPVIAKEKVSMNDFITNPSLWVNGNIGFGYINNNVNLYKKSINTVSPSININIGYDFNRYIGIYSGYNLIDSMTDNNSINIFSLGFKGNLPLYKRWSIFGKVGMSYLNGNTSSYNSSGSLGFGFEYKVTNSISTQFGYDYYQNLELKKSSVGLSKIYWGMTYRFGQVTLPIIKSQQVDIVETTISDVSVLIRKNYIISFPTGKSILDNEDKSVLAELLEVMHKFPEVNAKITGRADATGNALINDKISKSRSLSVYRYLISHGISSDRLIREWLSDSSPIDSNSSKNSELERSVQIILY